MKLFRKREKAAFITGGLTLALLIGVYGVASQSSNLTVTEGKISSTESAAGETSGSSDTLTLVDDTVVAQGGNSESVEAALGEVLGTSSGKTVTIVLDPGHCGTHAGTTGNGQFVEAATNLRIAQYCREELSQYAGVNVVMTRTSSACPAGGGTTSACLSSRSRISAANRADAFISIHCNYSSNTSASGSMAYVPNSNGNSAVSQVGNALANQILSALTGADLRNRGTQTRNSDDGSGTDYYAVIRENKANGIPAIIVEHGFTSNAHDAALLKSEAGLRNMGVADATGIARYFGLSKNNGSNMGAFNARYYKATYSDLRNLTDQQLYEHYMTYGLREGREGSPVFSINYYKNAYSDLQAAFGNNLEAYVTHFENNGMSEGRQASSRFNFESYYNEYADLRAAFGSNRKSYYLHYNEHGYYENRHGTGYDGPKAPDINTLNSNNSSSSNSSISNSSSSSSLSTRTFGSGPSTSTTALRNTSFGIYSTGLSSNTGISTGTFSPSSSTGRAVSGSSFTGASGFNSRTFGTGSTGSVSTVANGVDYSRVYDFNYYQNRYSDVRNTFGSDQAATFNHFLTVGISEGRQGSESFNLDTYKNNYSDLRSTFGSNNADYYSHYSLYGGSENRVGSYSLNTVSSGFRSGSTATFGGVDYSSVFNFDYYVSNNSDVASRYGNDREAVLGHFVSIGMEEGRQGSEEFNLEDYKAMNEDLVALYGSDNARYYNHFIVLGQYEGRAAS